MLEVYYIGAV